MKSSPNIEQKTSDFANDLAKSLIDEGSSNDYIDGFLTGLDLAVTSMKTIIEGFDKLNDAVKARLLLSGLSHPEHASK